MSVVPNHKSTTTSSAFSGDPDIVEVVLELLAEVTTYEVEQITPAMTLIGYMQMDPERDIIVLVKKLNNRFSIALDPADLTDHDASVEELIELVETEVELA